MWHLFFSFFFVFCLPFIVLRVPLPFSYCLSVVSFFLVFLLSPSLLFFFASQLSLVADSDILLYRLGATPPPRGLRAWSMRIPLALCLLSCVLAFFDFDLDIVCFILSVLCCLLGFGFCCDLFSVYIEMLYIHVYADLKTFYFRNGYVSVIVCIIFRLLLFSSWGNLPLQSSWSHFRDHGLHCSDELMWEQQRSTCGRRIIRKKWKISACFYPTARKILYYSYKEVQKWSHKRVRAKRVHFWNWRKYWGINSCIHTSTK